MKNKIAFITLIIPSYKSWIYQELSNYYQGEFIAVHGANKAGSRPNDVGWSTKFRNVVVKNSYINFLGFELSYSNSVFWTIKNNPDLIILQDGARIISNYLIHLIVKIRNKKILYYSHGYNHQASFRQNKKFGNLIEYVRIWYLKRSDGVLVYSSEGKEYSRKKINVSVYNTFNTLDTKAIIKCRNKVRLTDLPDEITKNNSYNKYILYFGRFIPEKKLGFFVRVLQKIHEKDKSILGVMVGDGPVLSEIKNMALETDNIIFTGPKYNMDLYNLISGASLIFIPGMVGLAIVDSFCFGKPLYTIDHDFHSPEISYLEHDFNGKLLPESIETCVNEILKDLKDDTKMGQMKKNAYKTIEEKCSCEKMKIAFIDAINDLLIKP